jgi:hypothetical protein
MRFKKGFAVITIPKVITKNTSLSLKLLDVFFQFKPLILFNEFPIYKINRDF